jgi:1,4-dihydroxy-2-naphthoate polyprenyltransferase
MGAEHLPASFARAWALVRLGRPVFLLGGLVLHALGVALAVQRGATISPAVALWGQLAVTAIQLMTHYSNDYFDFATDAANATPTRWSGGSRVLPGGELPRSVALVAALVCAALAVAAMIGLAGVLAHRSVIVLLGLMLIGAWSYSSPPLRLHSRGLGESTVVLVVAIATPLVGYLGQTGRIDAAVASVCLPLALLQLGMLLTIELPDEAGDRATGKRTFVVGFGAARAVACTRLAVVASYAVLPGFVAVGLPSTVPIAMALTAPLAALQLWRLRAERWRDPSSWPALAFGSVALFFASMLAALLGVLLAID